MPCRDCWKRVDGVHICEPGDLARVTAHYRVLAEMKKEALVDIWRGPQW